MDAEEKAFWRSLNNHFVGLGVIFPSDNGEKHYVYSGFVMSIDNHWFFMTAGHVMQQIEGLLQHYPQEGQVRFYLDDGGGTRISDILLPFSYSTAHKFFCDDTQGNDYGIIELSYLDRENLSANHVVPLDERYWQHLPTQFDGYALLGLPRTAQALSCQVDTNQLHLFRAEQFAPENGHDLWRESPRFCARISHEDLKDKFIDGMSGGPIFGFIDRKENYRLIAVQSSALHSRREIAGCFIGPLIPRIRTEFFSS